MTDTPEHSSLARRRFLQILTATGGVIAVPIAASRIFSDGTSATAPAGGLVDDAPAPSLSTTITDTGLILVAIQLGGGNDGLNTVVPIESADYQRLRGTAAIAVNELSVLDDTFGLAALPYLGEQWADGSLAIVHGVGISDGSLSHFDATALWESASLDPNETTGWLGRALDQLSGSEADPLVGMSIGGASDTMASPRWSPYTVPASGVVPWSEAFIRENAALAEAFPQLNMSDTSSTSLTALVRQSQVAVQDIGQRIDQAVPADDQAMARQRGGGDRLMSQLLLVADVVNAGLPTRAFHVRHGGFDTHANQRATHPRLLGQLDDAIRAFHDRLGANRERVVIMTWSEFGRRAEFNGSGTDHGAAAPAFVIGAPVQGGHHGEPPPLDRLDTNGNLSVTTDFRDYLGGVTAACLGVDPDVVAPGSTPLELLS